MDSGFCISSFLHAVYPASLQLPTPSEIVLGSSVARATLFLHTSHCVKAAQGIVEENTAQHDIPGQLTMGGADTQKVAQFL